MNARLAGLEEQKRKLVRRSAKIVARAFAEVLGDLLPGADGRDLTPAVIDTTNRALRSMAEQFNLEWTARDIQAVRGDIVETVGRYLMPF